MARKPVDPEAHDRIKQEGDQNGQTEVKKEGVPKRKSLALRYFPACPVPPTSDIPPRTPLSARDIPPEPTPIPDVAFGYPAVSAVGGFPGFDHPDYRQWERAQQAEYRAHKAAGEVRRRALLADFPGRQARYPRRCESDDQRADIAARPTVDRFQAALSRAALMPRFSPVAPAPRPVRRNPARMARLMGEKK